MQNIAIMLAGVALGTAIWLLILRRYDKIEPESIRHLLQVALIGGIASVVVAATFNELGRWLLSMNHDLFGPVAAVQIGHLFVFCLFIGFNEEICKSVATVHAAHHLGDLDEPIDAMIYAMTVGLGFAAFENILYATRFGNEVLLARFLWPVPAHMAYAALWGYGLAKARFVYPHKSKIVVMAPAVILASVLHATANFLLFLQETATALLSLAALAILAVLAHVRLKQLVAESPFLEPGECSSCRHVNDPAAVVCINCNSALGDTVMFVTCPRGCSRVPAYADVCPECGAALGGGDGTPALSPDQAHM
jgi:protease PrsW